MPRPPNPDLIRPWKNNIPAATAGKVEFLLMDGIHNKPRYAARSKLITALLEWWIARERGDTPPHVPSIAELQQRGL